MKSLLKKIIPPFVFSYYHWWWNFGMALLNGFPAKKLTVIMVTGTKGKTTVTEYLYHALKETGHKTILINGIHFVLPETELRNTFKMTTPGHGYIHTLLRQAKNQGATHAVIEMTSEASVQYRHMFLYPDITMITNLQKEHIESHGSFENYKQAKRNIVEEVLYSKKPNPALILNGDEKSLESFKEIPASTIITFSESEIKNLSREIPTTFMYNNTSFEISNPGKVSALNALAVIKATEHLNISLDEVSSGLKHVKRVRGRMESISLGQPFEAVVDYAHTPDSLIALYESFPNKKKVCVLGNTGGGRDTWKRPEMARIAEEYCDTVILTNEDPYDEDPQKILDEMAAGMGTKPTIIMDRREAIRHALSQTPEGGVTFISGKGTDPYIMEANGKKTPWDDATVVREELAQLGHPNL